MSLHPVTCQPLYSKGAVTAFGYKINDNNSKYNLEPVLKKKTLEEHHAICSFHMLDRQLNRC